MSQQIRYKDNGDRIFYIDGKEVTAKEFWGDDKDTIIDMLAEQRAPHGISDCTFMRNTANGKQFESQPGQGDYYRSIAEGLGASTTGKKYISGLAAFPGDPEAWVDGRGDVEKILEKRGWGSEGTVNVKPREAKENPIRDPHVDDKLLNEYTNGIAERDPHPDLVDRNDLKEQVRERLSPKKHKPSRKLKK